MSVQFGWCNFDDKPLDPKDLDRVRSVLSPYGPDGEGYICRDNVGIVYRAFHTTKEGRLEKQPHVAPSGAVITWDGRLDNREELVGQLQGVLSTNSTDILSGDVDLRYVESPNSLCVPSEAVHDHSKRRTGGRGTLHCGGVSWVPRSYCVDMGADVP